MEKIKGIDVSTWQSNIDWDKVKKDGIEFAIIRSSFGRFPSQVDNEFENHYKGAKAVGMPVGAYHYSYAQNVQQAQEEADFFLQTLKGKKFEYPVVFDLEDPSQANLGKKNLTDIAVAFCSKVQSAGYYVMLYASLDWLDNKLDYERIKPFAIWVAQYNSVNQFEHPYGMWQYSSTGTVNGIKGGTDMNYAYVDYPARIKAWGLNGFPKPGITEGDLTGMQQGNTGDGVFALKISLRTAKQLNVIKTVVNVDNIFGDGTKAAVMEVQKIGGLTENGVAGSKTMKKLYDLNTAAIERLGG